MKGDKTGLKQSDFVSCLNPASHAIIDTVNLNIGECSINRTDRQYPLIAKLKYLCRYSTKARNTFLKTFEEYIDDTDEKLKTVSKLLFYKIKQILITNFTSVNYFWIFFTQNIQSTYQAVTTTDKDGNTSTNYVANSAQSLLAESMLGFTKDSAFLPTEKDVLIQLFSPLRNFSSLVPSGLDVQWRLNFSDDKRFFVTESTTANPMFQITGVFELYLCIFYQTT